MRHARRGVINIVILVLRGGILLYSTVFVTKNSSLLREYCAHLPHGTVHKRGDAKARRASVSTGAAPRSFFPSGGRRVGFVFFDGNGNGIIRDWWGPLYSHFYLEE